MTSMSSRPMTYRLRLAIPPRADRRQHFVFSAAWRCCVGRRSFGQGVIRSPRIRASDGPPANSAHAGYESRLDEAWLFLDGHPATALHRIEDSSHPG